MWVYLKTIYVYTSISLCFRMYVAYYHILKLKIWYSSCIKRLYATTTTTTVFYICSRCLTSKCGQELLWVIDKINVSRRPVAGLSDPACWPRTINIRRHPLVSDSDNTHKHIQSHIRNTGEHMTKIYHYYI